MIQKSFRELSKEDKMTRIKDFSDRIASEAVEALSGMEVVEKLIREEGITFPVTRNNHTRGKNGKKTYFSIPSNPEIDGILNEMSLYWGVSKASIVRIALWFLCYKYGWAENTNKILRNTDRKAICRDDRVARPLVHRAIAIDKRERTSNGIRNYGGDNAKRPPGLHTYSD